MTDLLLPGPSGGERSSGGQSSRGSDERHCPDEEKVRPKPRIASEDDCLAALSSLPSLLAMGMLTTQQVSAIRSVHATILQHHQKKQTASNRQPLENSGLTEMLRKHPELANELASLLSDEQIAIIMAESKDGSDGTA